MDTNDQLGRDTVRELARQVAELAASEENAYRRKLWNDVNSLRMPDRPPAVCHPGCWGELLPRDDMQSQDDFHAGVEYRLRQILYKHEVGDDSVIEPWWSVSPAVKLEGEHFWGLPIGYTRPDVPGGSYRYDPPIREEADIEGIVPPKYTHDADATERNQSKMQDLLGDFLPVKVTCAVPGPGAWFHGWATQLCGLQELMQYLMDRPQWVHRLMGILQEGFLELMDQFEEMGLLSLNNHGLSGCDDLPQPDFDGEHVRLIDMWGRGESQEFQLVGPRHHEEFLLEYQKPVLERYGLSFYGCCEDLTQKIDLVLTIPNLRRFVCGPWTDLEKLVNAVGNRYCIEWRQRATDVVFTPGLGPIRDHLERGMRIARQTPMGIILQELETLDGRPERLKEWAEAAKKIGESLS